MQVGVGDILATRGDGFGSKAIRLGAALEDEPNTVNHICVIHHIDNVGTIWGIEGRPGGVGYVDTRKYLENPYTITNAEQPKTLAQREWIAQKSTSMLGTPYDWQAIADDACIALLKRNFIWTMRDFGDEPPAQVVCSSFAVWLNHHAGLAYPDQHGERSTTPADWVDWIIRKGWIK